MSPDVAPGRARASTTALGFLRDRTHVAGATAPGPPPQDRRTDGHTQRSGHRGPKPRLRLPLAWMRSFASCRESPSGRPGCWVNWDGVLGTAPLPHPGTLPARKESPVPPSPTPASAPGISDVALASSVCILSPYIFLFMMEPQQSFTCRACKTQTHEAVTSGVFLIPEASSPVGSWSRGWRSGRHHRGHREAGGLPPLPWGPSPTCSLRFAF